MQIDENKIGDKLGLEPIKLEDDPKPTQKMIPAASKDTAEDDFDYARGNLINIISKGGEAVDEMLDFARASQHPRSYEVLSTLLKTLTDANKDLLQLSKTRKELNTSDDQPQTVNQNLFVGSTAELQKLLKDSNEEPR